MADPLQIIGVRPIFRTLHQPCLHRVQVDVTAKVNQVFLAIDAYVSEATLEESPATVLLPIDCLHISVEQHIDELGNRDIRLLSEQEVIVIGHQAVGDDGDTIALGVTLDEA